MVPWSYVDESRLEVEELSLAEIPELQELLAFGAGEFGYSTDATGGLGHNTPAYLQRVLADQALACRYEGRLVGFISFAWSDGGRTSLVVRNVFVHPSFRDGSVLFALVEALLDDDDPDCRSVVAAVEPANRAAIAAARKLGFCYLPRRRYALVSHVPLILGIPLARRFFARHNLDASEYFLHLRRRPLHTLGPAGDEETFDGRRVCRYRFQAGTASFEAAVDLDADAVTAVRAPDVACALRTGGSRRFDADGARAWIDLENAGSGALDGSVAWCDSAAPANPVGRAFRLGPGERTCLPFEAGATAGPGRHRSAVVLQAGNDRIELLASYVLARAVAVTPILGPAGSAALVLRNRTGHSLDIEVAGPLATCRVLEPGATSECLARPGDSVEVSITSTPHLHYRCEIPSTAAGLASGIRRAREVAALHTPHLIVAYDVRSQRLAWASPGDDCELLRRRWIETGPPYWTVDGGSPWVVSLPSVDSSRGELSIERGLRDGTCRLQETVRVLSDGASAIEYRPLSRSTGRLGVLLEFVGPHPTVRAETAGRMIHFAPVRGERPNRFDPLRPDRRWLEVDDGTHSLRVEWAGGEGSLLADVESLKLLLEFGQQDVGGVVVRCRSRHVASATPDWATLARSRLEPLFAPGTPATASITTTSSSHIRLESGDLRADLSLDARGPLVSLARGDREWLSCSYPRFEARGRDRENCGGLALRVSADPDAPSLDDWVRDFDPPRLEHHPSRHWRGVAQTGSLDAIGLPDVRVERRIEAFAGSCVLRLSTVFENLDDEPAHFSAGHVLSPLGTEQSDFRVEGRSGVGRFSRGRTRHEAIVPSRGGLICGAGDRWLAMVSPNADLLGHEQGRSGFTLASRRRFGVKPLHRASMEVFIVPAAAREDAMEGAAVLLGAPW